MRITVERPLRLRWEVSDETLAAVAVAKGLSKLAESNRAVLLDSLTSERGWSTPDGKAAAKVIDPLLKPLGLSTPQAKAVWSAIAVRDPEAPPVTDRTGNPEPDPDLRDGENVPLPAVHVVFESDVTGRLESREYRTAVDDYIRAEVLPYAAEAWVDRAKTKVGYEIPVTRHFYQYVPPRPLKEIDAEIKALEVEIQRLIIEVTE